MAEVGAILMVGGNIAGYTRVIEEIILKLRQEARTLVIMATHDMEQVKRITDRVIRIEQGRIAV
jgi:ABC-type Na+ transport system ATPase subunit NatA